ncbi:unnamed protein product, partial [Brassica oleracea var. botrytis]
FFFSCTTNINKNEFLHEQTANKNDLIIAKSRSFTKVVLH